MSLTLLHPGGTSGKSSARTDQTAQALGASTGFTAGAAAFGVSAGFASATGAGATGFTAGIIGSLVGTVLGMFMGLFGLLFMPLIGAAIGEFWAKRDLIHAGRVGVATWVGMIVGTAVKVALAFAMTGILVFVYLTA